MRASSSSRDASTQLVAHLGEDAGRVPELVEVLALDVRRTARRSTSTTSRRTSATSAPPAASISRTRSTAAMSRPRSKCCTGSSLRRARANRSRCTRCRSWRCSSCHYQRLLRLDDPVDHDEGAGGRGARDEERRRRALPARGGEAAGHDGLREAMQLLARAELDLRGFGGIDERTVIDVLVARLAALDPPAPAVDQSRVRREPREPPMTLRKPARLRKRVTRAASGAT